MAQPIFVNVPENFSMDSFAYQLANIYTTKGYMVQSSVNGNNAALTISKGMDGFTKFIGMGESVVVNCMVNNGTLTVSFMNEETNSKIIAIVIGFFCCTVLCITGIIGILNQNNLPKTIGMDATMLAPGCVYYENATPNA